MGDNPIELAVAWTPKGVICYNRVEAVVTPTHQEETV
jgi:hypothetical protein